MNGEETWLDRLAGLVSHRPIGETLAAAVGGLGRPRLRRLVSGRNEGRSRRDYSPRLEKCISTLNGQSSRVTLSLVAEDVGASTQEAIASG